MTSYMPSPKKLRSSVLPYDWKKSRMLCGNLAQFDAHHPERDRVYNVTTLPMHVSDVGNDNIHVTLVVRGMTNMIVTHAHTLTLKH